MSGQDEQDFQDQEAGQELSSAEAVPTDGAAPVAEGPNKDERLLAMLAHLLALSGAVIPFGNIIGPLIIWLVKKDESPFVDDQGKESVNFQISVTIYSLVSLVLCLVFIGVVLIIAVSIFALVMVILAAIAANQGERYRYPLCIRFIS